MTDLVPLKRIARLAYGEALPSERRNEGKYPVVGSGGACGTHHSANFGSPGIVVGRKGSHGSVHWIPSGGFAIDTAYFIDATRTRADLRWLYYALQAVSLRGATQDVGVPGLAREDAHQVLVPCVPMREQRRIADFLDGELARIDKVNSLRVAQEAILRDRLRAALGEAFEGAASGSRIRLKHLLASRPRYGVLVPQFVEDGVDGVPFIRVGDLGELEERAEALPRIPAALSSQYARTIVRPGDLLLSVVGTLGRSAVAPPSVVGANIARAICSIRLDVGVSPELIQAWFGTTGFLRQALAATSTDTAQPTLGMEDLWNFRLVWPSSPREREELSREERRIQSATSAAVMRLQKQRAVLAERRQALITAAVNGQIDVSMTSGRRVSEGAA